MNSCPTHVLQFIVLERYSCVDFFIMKQKDAKQKAHEQRQVKNKLRERRLASARARRYYDDYQLRMRSRQLKRKTKEEKVCLYV